MRRLTLPVVILAVVAVSLLLHAVRRSPAGDSLPPAPPAKPADFAAFERLLEKNRDLTYDQLRDRAGLPLASKPLSFDPTTAKYYDRVSAKLQLTPAERDLYAKGGLVSIDTGERHTFASAYYHIYNMDLPVLVTADSILHAVHRSYDDILMEMEEQLFAPAVAKVLADAHAALLTHPQRDTDPARDADLYLTVARNLFAGAGAEPAELFDGFRDGRRVNEPAWDGKTLKVGSHTGQDAAALALLNNIRSLKLPNFNSDPPTAIYGGSRHIDCSQFRPRGHYTKSAGLKVYFRAMMWLGRADCGWNVAPVDSATEGVTGDPDRELRAAVLFTELLRDSGGLKRLKAVDDVLAFMVGRSDNLTPFGMAELMAAAHVPGLAAALDELPLRRLRGVLDGGDHATQAIRSQVLIETDPGRKTKPPGLFQVFGQRFVVDSFLLSQLVFDSIVYHGVKQDRTMPSGLDTAAALGNPAAVELLEPDLRGWNYAGNLAACREYVAAKPAAFWGETLYNRWLDALRPLHAEPSADTKFPEVMRTEPWRRKQLQTQLGSWAELRHDTILYAKESYDAGLSCEYPAGYVEPYPEFYAKLEAFAAEAVKRFLALGVQNGDLKEQADRYAGFFGKMRGITGRLAGLARKELAGQTFSEDEKVFLRQVVHVADRGCAGPATYDGWYCSLLYQKGRTNDFAPEIADIHTDPNTLECLQVGTGAANLLVVAVDNGPDRMTFVGPAYSYYEFRRPANDRLTDEKWQGMLETGSAPPRPKWVDAFQAPARPAAAKGRR